MPAAQVRILVVAPEGRMRDGLRVVLQAMPEVKEVVFVAGSRLAQEEMAQKPPHLLVWDDDVPVEDIPPLRGDGQPRHLLPCVVLSREWPCSFTRECCQLLLKGFSTEELHTTVRGVLAQALPVES